MSSTSEKELYPHEWLAIIFIIAILSIITLATHSSESAPSANLATASHYVVNQYIEVSIEGAVESPGKHTLKKGASIKELLNLAKLLPNADLKHIKEEKILRQGQKVKIPQFEMVTIILKFKDTSQEINVKKGTKIEELPHLYTFDSNVNLKSFQKKRRVKNGEVIRVASLTFPDKVEGALETVQP
jgi:hypothetical protein